MFGSSTRQLNRSSRSEIISQPAQCLRKGGPRSRDLLIRGFTSSSLLLAGMLAAINPRTAAAAHPLSDPTGQSANLRQSEHRFSRLDGDPERTLLTDLESAEDRYADQADPARFEQDLAVAFKRVWRGPRHGRSERGNRAIGVQTIDRRDHLGNRPLVPDTANPTEYSQLANAGRAAAGDRPRPLAKRLTRSN